MNEQLSFVAETLETAEVINNLVRTNLRDGGYLLAEFKNFGGSAGEHAAAKLFKAAPKLLEVAHLVLSAHEHRADKDFQLMHLDLREAAEIVRAAIRAATE